MIPTYLFIIISCTVLHNACSSRVLVDPVLQWHNCNNCYAVTARDVLLWHMPHLKNVTIKDGSVIESGSVVKKDVGENEFVTSNSQINNKFQ